MRLTIAQELSESMGLSSLNERLQDPAAMMWVQGIFPKVLLFAFGSDASCYWCAANVLAG